MNRNGGKEKKKRKRKISLLFQWVLSTSSNSIISLFCKPFFEKVFFVIIKKQLGKASCTVQLPLFLCFLQYEYTVIIFLFTDLNLFLYLLMFLFHRKRDHMPNRFHLWYLYHKIQLYWFRQWFSTQHIWNYTITLSIQLSRIPSFLA